MTAPKPKWLIKINKDNNAANKNRNRQDYERKLLLRHDDPKRRSHNKISTGFGIIRKPERQRELRNERRIG